MKKLKGFSIFLFMPGNPQMSRGLVALLKADAALAMPPSPHGIKGQSAIGTFVAATVFGDGGMFPGQAVHRWRLLSTHANGSPAFAIYQRDEKNEYQPFGLIALTIVEGKLSQIISFIDPSLPPLFGFPAKLGQP